MRHTQIRQREPAIGLLPTEPAVRGQARGKNYGTWIGKISWCGNAHQDSLATGESAFDPVPETR
ncbi:MAG TPA: hypothetical protein VFM94_03860, partial [Solirubrobacterales bacterium]|nr:hypothetical protein [Solirubrobacterales bacterium]